MKANAVCITTQSVEIRRHRSLLDVKQTVSVRKLPALRSVQYHHESMVMKVPPCANIVVASPEFKNLNRG
ncbi:hypothetical protein, partial [Endozoicomonas sp. ONNA2]|uniref:hypothetical protein n=1 Tax=Endozoicomonas sp. ONNA2 TaxID=2828741 RepID=UPI002147E237